jgi:branched-chain amino acid transport system substrate-binding protein
MFVFGRWLLLFLVLCLAGCGPRGANEVIPIGNVIPLSGPDKTVGEHMRQALDLAVEEVNKEGNRISNHSVVIVHADGGGDKAKAQEQAVRLLTVNRVFALLSGIDAAQVEAVSWADRDYTVPLLAPAVVPAATLNDFVFSTNVAPAVQGQTLARYLLEEVKPAQVVILTDSRDAVSTSVSATLLREVGKANVPADDWPYKSDSDIPELVSRMKGMGTKPAAICCLGSAADLGKLRPKLHEVAPDAVLLFATTPDGLAALSEDRTAKGPVHLLTAVAAEGLSPIGQEFAKKYQEKFGQEPDAPAVLACDNARLMFEALRKPHSLDGKQQLRQSLGALENVDGLTGSLTVTKEHTVRRPLFIVRLEEGRTKLVKRYDPEAK